MLNSQVVSGRLGAAVPALRNQTMIGEGRESDDGQPIDQESKSRMLAALVSLVGILGTAVAQEVTVDSSEPPTSIVDILAPETVVLFDAVMAGRPRIQGSGTSDTRVDQLLVGYVAVSADGALADP